MHTKDIKKFRVGVLMGGRSVEHEVSFNSGRTVCDHLDTTRYAVIPIFQKNNGMLYILPWRFLHRGKTTDFVSRLDAQAEKISWDQLKQHIDFMYIAVHGQYAEDGILQGALELLNIPYLGAKVFASALCMDKKIQKTFLQQHGIQTPKDICIPARQAQNYASNWDNLSNGFSAKTGQVFAVASQVLVDASHSGDESDEILVKAQQNSSKLTEQAKYCKSALIQQLIAQNLSLPYIVKPYKEGSSIGVSVVRNYDELGAAIAKACYANNDRIQDVLIEEKIEGMEFSCITLTDYKNNRLLPLPPTEIVPEVGTDFFDYEQKYMPGRAHKFTPARCDDEIIKKIQDSCVATMQALGVTNLSRVDGFVTSDKRVIIMDPNSLSGMGPASFLFREAAEINMSHTQLINHLIETELHSYGLLENILTEEKKNIHHMEKPKRRIAVLMGGDSNEREISLESGRNVTYKLSPQKYEVIPIFVSDAMELFTLTQSFLVRSSTKEIELLCDRTNKIVWSDLPVIADFVFIALHGGKGENGTVQGMLEMLDMPYNGSSVLASGLCMDKYKTNQFLNSHGFSTPQSYLITKDAWDVSNQAVITQIKTTLSFPLIAKPHDDGCSVLVKKVYTEAELIDAFEEMYVSGKNSALIEEFITGMELTVGVIGNHTPRALPPSQTVTKSDILSIEEKFLPGAGENQTPAPLPAQTIVFVQKTIESVYQAIGCVGYARIDCFYQSAAESKTGKERLIILEINTLPGMTPATCIFHQAAEIGIKPMDFIDQIIELGFEQHRKNNITDIFTTINEQAAQ